MKKLFVVFSLLALIAVGCNKSGNKSSGGGTDMQKEEQSSHTGNGQGSQNSNH